MMMLPMKFLSALILPLLLMQTGSAATLTSGYTVGSGLLGNGLIIDNAGTGGGDSSAASGNLGWTAELAGLWNSNATVTLSGIALPIWSDTNAASTTVSGTFTFYFYDLDQGTDANAFDGTGMEKLLGTATASFTQGAVGTYYAFFEVPISFTAKSSGVAVRIVNTGWLRLKVNNAASAPGVICKNNVTGVAIGGTNPNFRISLAGTVSSPSIFPSRVNLAKYQVTTASTENGQYVADFLTDGLVNNNSWRTLTVNTPHWAEVDFPAPVTIASAHVYSGIDDGSVLGSFKVQYKSGASWLDAPGSSRSGNTSSEVKVIFSSAVTSAAFRIYSDDNGNQRVKELALFPPNPATNGVEQGYPIGTDVELNLAKKRPAVATAFSATNYPKLAVDGFVDDQSKWQTTLVGSNGLEIDLRISTKIGSAHLYSGATGAGVITNFVLQYWTGTAWANISGASVTGNTSPALVIDFTTEPTTDMVRVVFTNSSVSAIRELCIFPANGGTGYPLGQDVINGLPPTQTWEDYNDAFYQLRNRAADLSISMVSNAPSLNTANEVAELSQYQILFNIGTDTYRVRNRITGQCLAGSGLSTNTGAFLVDQDYTAMPHQNWRMVPYDGTDFYLVNEWSGLAIDTQGAGMTPGTRLVQSTPAGSVSQRWRAVFQARYPRKGSAGFIQNAAAFKSNWGYNWGRTTPHAVPSNFVFNPMQWGNFNWDIGSAQGPVEQFLSEWRREDKAMHYLGFNEPDGTAQANLTVDKAIELWPRLERMDQPLVSPVTVNPLNSWMTTFMPEATNRGYRIDAVAAHKYPAPRTGTNGGDPSAIIAELQTLYNTWGRPVWFTEFSTVDWNNNSSWTEEDNYNWLAEFMWRAESLSWLRHYSLFLFTANATWPEPTSPSDPVAPRSNAFKSDGVTPTSFGELYFAWDCDANVRGDKAYFIHNRGERKRLRNAVSSSAPSQGTIREGTDTTQWVLRAAPTAGQWYITSLRDGRRLRSLLGVLDFAPVGATGSAVTWSVVNNTNGWFYLENPAAPTVNRRLSLASGTFSMISNTTTNDQVKWRFVVPYAPVDAALPAAPVNLTALAGANQVSLNWFSGGTPNTTYSIYRSLVAGGPYSLINSSIAPTAYVHSSPTIGVTNYYVVTAVDGLGNESNASNQAFVVPVSPLPSAPTNITYTISNNVLVLNWPPDYTGWLLQVQTNSLGVGLGSDWLTIAESATNSSYLVPLDVANPSVFFRLTKP
jgi:hypothetical protein